MAKLVEIRTIDSHSKQIMIYRLLSIGKLKKYINKDGYVCFDSAEFEKYSKSKRRGRPAKMN